ncbi:hypothetical protein UK30_10260 [Salmonella enterica]|nr:hypothetical protein [Salmonella enterica]
MQMTGARRWKLKQKLTAFCRNGRVLFLKGQLIKKSCQYRVTFCIREMADAGNFGGSVSEDKSNAVLSLPVPFAGLFFLSISGRSICHYRGCVLRYR